jgi:hypothetical protein
VVTGAWADSIPCRWSAYLLLVSFGVTVSHYLKVLVYLFNNSAKGDPFDGFIFENSIDFDEYT